MQKQIAKERGFYATRSSRLSSRSHRCQAVEKQATDLGVSAFQAFALH